MKLLKDTDLCLFLTTCHVPRVMGLTHNIYSLNEHCWMVRRLLYPGGFKLRPDDEKEPAYKKQAEPVILATENSTCKGHEVYHSLAWFFFCFTAFVFNLMFLIGVIFT